MSRIVGILSGAPSPQQSVLNEMLAASRSHAGWLSHSDRGAHAALGWCGWRRPNVARLEEVLVVMDGSIYNRAELGRADTDAGLLASLYLKDGFAETLRRLNGDFAIALYDSKRETLWLARDRFGVKPLYYVADQERVAFASRPRALLTLPGLSRDVNRLFVALFAASHYRTFDHDPAQSPYADIAQLPAGSMLRVSRGAVTQSAYWSLQELPDFTQPEGQLAERYRALLLDAVALRCQAAQRPVFTLSGGMDSSSVLALAVRATDTTPAAISTVYDDATYDESRDIRGTVEALGVAWHQVRVGTPDVLSLVTRMIELHDEPVATATWLSHYLLCGQAKNLGFRSLFGGLGGDELNAGEYEHFLFFFADLRAAGLEADLQRETARWIAHHDHPMFRKRVDVMEDALARLVDLTQPGRCLPDHRRLGRYASALNPEYYDLAGFEPPMDRPFRSYLKNRTFQDLFRETIPCCLRAEDRQTVACELDSFLPFLDYRVVEFMFRVPGTLKIRAGVTKHLLRQAMRGVLSEATRTRVKKTGWNAPAHRWFSGPGRRLLEDLVDSHAFRTRGIYNVEEVRRLIEEHDQIVSAGRAEDNHMMFLWQLVNLELWHQSLEQAPKPHQEMAASGSPRQVVG